MNQKLGTTVVDKITGFRGVVTGRVEYISGCNQLLVTPKSDKDGALNEAQWFDEQRCATDNAVQIIKLENEKSPGFDKAAPKR